MEQEIGDIGNYYGSLTVKRENAKYFWSIGNWDGHNWEEIPEFLYKTLLKYERNRIKILKL